MAAVAAGEFPAAAVGTKEAGKVEEILLLGAGFVPGARQGVVRRCSSPSWL